MPAGELAAAGDNSEREPRQFLALSPKGALLGKENVMSNLRDAMGLRMPYGKQGSQFETEFEPGTGTIWGYFNPRGTPCFSLGLLKDIRTHDEALARDGG